MDKYEIKAKIEKNKKISKMCITIVLILFIGILIMDFVLLYKDNEKYNIENMLGIQIIILIVIIVAINIFVEILNKIYFKKYIRNKYNDFIFKNINKKELIYKPEKKEGKIRYKYLYSLYLPQYKCTLNRYYEQKLIKFERFDPSTERIYTVYKYVTKNNILEYIFELDSSCWCTLDEIRKIIETAELRDNKIIITKFLPQNKRITILDEFDFVENIGKIYLKIINFVDKG